MVARGVPPTGTDATSSLTNCARSLTQRHRRDLTHPIPRMQNPTRRHCDAREARQPSQPLPPPSSEFYYINFIHQLLSECKCGQGEQEVQEERLEEGFLAEIFLSHGRGEFVAFPVGVSFGRGQKVRLFFEPPSAILNIYMPETWEPCPPQKAIETRAEVEKESRRNLHCWVSTKVVNISLIFCLGLSLTLAFRRVGHLLPQVFSIFSRYSGWLLSSPNTPDYSATLGTVYSLRSASTVAPAQSLSIIQIMEIFHTASTR